MKKNCASRFRSVGWLTIACGCLSFVRLGAAQPLFHSPFFPETVQPAAPIAADDPDTQTLTSLMAARQAAIATALTLPNRDAVLAQIAAAESEQLESFVTNHPNSAWTPGLYASLGQWQWQRGRTTLALEHWGAAWNVTQTATSGPAKQVADYALAHWTRLLACLGRLEDLGPILSANAQRHFYRGDLAQIWIRTREAFGHMVRHPEIAYKCAVLDLNQVALALYGTNVLEILQTPAPDAGFTLAQLQSLAQAHQLNLVAVVRPSGVQLVVPSIIHWSLNHWAAIVGQHGALYEVFDTSFGGRRFLDADTINAEASGYFLVPANAVPPGWRVLSASEAAQVVGRSYFYDFADQNDQPCHPPPGQCCITGATGGGKRGGSKSGRNLNGTGANDLWAGATVGGSCSSCGEASQQTGFFLNGGLPAWQVSEPSVNLWIYDTPLAYQPSRGPAVDFQLSYKQRDENGTDENPGQLGNYTTVGANWNCSWRSYVDAAWLTSGNGPVYVHVPGGGVSTFNITNGMTLTPSDYFNDTRLSIQWDLNGNLTGFSLLYPDGSHLDYGYSNAGFSASYFFLSAFTDPQGRQLSLGYGMVTTFLQLQTVQDPDSRVTTLYYDVPYPGAGALVTRVVGPYGTVHLNYDDNWNLTNLVDAAGISTTFAYGYLSYWPTNMTTPYGSTSFNLADNGTYDYMVDRYATITEPGGATQIYSLFSWADSSWGLPSSYSSSEIPQNTPLNTLDTQNRDRRSSYYWNRQQTPLLSTNDPTQFTASDYLKGRQRRWLAYDYASSQMDTISTEQAPSPDGSTEGAITWYDYAGKPSGTNCMQGSQMLPSVIARVQPDGSTWWMYYHRGAWGEVTNVTEKWTANGTDYFRTNTYNYASNEIDLVGHYGPNGELVRGVDYNANHQPLYETNALGEVTAYTYDSSRRLSTLLTPAGLLSTDTYGTDGYLASRVDSVYGGSAIATNSYTWLNAAVRTHTDPRGLTVTYTYDPLYRLWQVDYPDGTYTTNRYTADGTASGTPWLDLTWSRDRLGNVTTYTYNGLRQLTTRTDPLSRVTGYGYCECGALTSLTNAVGTPVQQVWNYSYDYQGRRTQTVNPDNTTISYQYDLPGRLTVVTDAWGSVTNAYDNLNRLVAVNNAYGQVRAVAYELHDWPTNTVDANGVSVASTYDLLGRLRTRTYPDSGVEAFGYTANVTGPTSYTNQISKVTRYGYDVRGLKTAETNANSEVVLYTNSPAGDLLTLTDGKSHTTQWNYDADGRVTNKLDQAGTVVLKYAYNADGRLLSRWSAAKGTTYYTNDAVGNLTGIGYPSSHSQTYSYDALNRVTNMVDAAGTTLYRYTAMNQILTEDSPFASDTLTNLYSNGLRVGLLLQQPTGLWTNGFAYDAAKRLTSVASPAGSFSYTLGGVGAASPLLKKLALPNSSYITNTYDSVARLTGTYLKNSGNTVLDSMAYAYNQAGQRTQQTRTDGSYVNYTYDNIGQLTSVVGSGGQSTESLGYAYDAGWNLNWRTNGGAASQFIVDTKNELTNWPSGPGTYDGNGNLISANGGSGGALTYVYDDENRRTSLSASASWRSDFAYDGLGRLRTRTDYTWTGSSWYPNGTTEYIYDGFRVIQERDGNNNPAVSYTRGSDLSETLEGVGGIGGLLARSTNAGGAWSTHAYYHTDGNGNITYLVDSSQALAASYRYDPFGNTLSSSGTLAGANVYRFSSKEIHVNSGMYYYGFRFYDPNLQRWPNRDPIGELGFEAFRSHGAISDTTTAELFEGANLYVFVANNPVTYKDLWGLKLTYRDCQNLYKECILSISRIVRGDYDTGKSGVKTGIIGAIGKAAGKVAGAYCSAGNTIYTLIHLGSHMENALERQKQCKQLLDRCIEVTTDPKGK